MSDIQGVKHQNYHKLYMNYIAIDIRHLMANILVIGLSIHSYFVSVFMQRLSVWMNESMFS